MGYREQPPPAALAPWLQCTWTRSAPGGRTCAGTAILGARCTRCATPLARAA